MFFSQPFILASEFVQHVGLIVLCGFILLEYVLQIYCTPAEASARRERIRTVGAGVVFLAVWIIGEYFVPVKSLSYTLLVQLPFALAVILFILRVSCTGPLARIAKIRTLFIGVFVVHVATNILAYTISIPEINLVNALFKSAEVVLIYVFVVQLLQHHTMTSTATRNMNCETPASTLSSAVSAVLLFLVVSFGVLGVTSDAYAINLITRIGDQSTEVKPGDRLYFDVEIKWPENPKRQDLRVEYQILHDGEVIASEKVLRAVETQASFLDYLVVPSNAEPGIKQLNVVIETYDQSLKESITATFYVEKTSNQLLLYFFILAAAIVLVVILVVFQIVMISRTQKILAGRSAA